MIIVFAYWAVCFLIVIALALSPVVLIIYGAVKKKKWMVITGAAVILVVVLHKIIFPTEFPYVDLWIQGKTR